MGAEQKAKAVFLSHSSKNYEQVKQIADYLENEYNIPCWYAPRNIKKGDQYYVRIVEDIETVVSVVVVFITEEVSTSKFVPKEIDRAFFYNKPVVPIILNGAQIPKNLELLLCDHQWIDYDQEGIGKLVEAVEEMYQGSERDGTEAEGIFMNEPVVLSSQKEVHLYKINPYILHRTAQVFVPFPKMTEAVNSLKAEQNLVLYNPQNTGKYTAAIALLQELDIKEIYEWSNEISMREIYNHPIKNHTGLILEVEDGSFFEKFPSHGFEEFVQRLKEKNCYMIIISKTEPMVPCLSTSQVKVDPPQDIKQIIKNYMDYQFESEVIQEKVEEWLLTDQAEAVLPDTFYPQDIKGILHNIKRYIQGELDAAQFESSLNEKVQQRVKSWFKENRETRDIAFYLTLALFEGRSFTFLEEKAQQLTDLLNKEFLREEKPVVHVSQEEFLQNFEAVTKQVWHNDDLGTDLREVVYFTYSEDAKFIWEYVWKQMHHLKKPLIHWLLFLIKNEFLSNKKMNPILVNLLKTNFSEIRREILQPLANSEQVKQRSYVVHLLEEAHKEEQIQQRVYRLAKTWAAQANNEKLQSTGIVLLGGEIGLKNFPNSLELLEPVIRAGRKSLFFPLQTTIQNLSQIVFRGEKYEHLYFQFWFKLFTGTDELQLQNVLRFAQGIYLKNPKLFFYSIERYGPYWFQFFNALYRRPTQNILLEKLAKRALGNPEREKAVSDILHLLREKGYEDSRSRIQVFIEDEMQKIDSPIFLNDYLVKE
ncbi:MAG: TIR domain-containing protein [Bacillota bacterium]